MSETPVVQSRREFLRLVGVAMIGASAEVMVGPRPASASESPEDLGVEHAGDAALLIDVTRCIGCAWCVTACKLANDLPQRDDQPWLGPDAQLASSNNSVVRTVEVDSGPRPDVRNVRRQCMHCLEPACVSVCPVAAMRKQPSGPVVYDADRCIGCRYCMMACPFGVPTFEWDRSIGRIRKCEMCHQRLAEGRQPACSSVCPEEAIVFGERAELLAEAWQRIRGEPDRYIHHVYGETEAGGTSALYVSDVSFEALGLPQGLPDEPLPEFTWQISRLIPGAASGIGAVLIALYARRRRALLEGTVGWRDQGAPSGDGDHALEGGTT